MTQDPDTSPCTRLHAGGRPSRDEAQAKPLRILDVAQRVFLAQGYAEATIDAIAQEACVAKKTLYEHFGDKSRLFAAVVQRLVQAWLDGLQGVVIDSSDPEAALHGAAMHLLEVGTRADMLELHRLLLIEARHLPELVSSRYGERGALVGMVPLADYLRRAVAQGLLELDDVDLATEQFVYLVLGGLRTRMLRGVSSRPDAQGLAAIAAQAVRIFLDGSRARGSASVAGS